MEDWLLFNAFLKWYTANLQVDRLAGIGSTTQNIMFEIGSASIPRSLIWDLHLRQSG
jgi:hypothetical protein